VFNRIKDTVSIATGVSVRTIERILKEGNNPPQDENEPIFRSPNKKRTRKCTVTELEDFEKVDFRNTIYNFHKTDGCRITLPALKDKVRSDFGWNGQLTSLRKIVKDLGFRFRKSQNNRNLLIEKSEIRALRINYLRKITLFREQNRSIIYLDETYIHSGHTLSKSWSDNSNNGLFTNISKGERLIIINAGGDEGFVPNCLQIFKSGSKTGDYHDEMNGANYEKWLSQKLIPNLPPKSVVIIDNAPYHNIQINRAPNSNSRRADMISWLTEKRITFSPSMLKPELYSIIKRYKMQHIQYKFDAIFEENGHTVVRLPPYHPDLNPIELIWAKVKRNVAKRNTTFKLHDIWKLAEEEFASVTVEDWKSMCNHVIKIEKHYMENELMMDIQSDKIIINLNEDSSDEEGSFSDDNEFHE
jgi:transposase